MTRDSIELRYQNDSTFHRVVDMIRALMNSDTELTPLDIRDAAYLARLQYEKFNVRPISLTGAWHERNEGQ